MSLYLGLGVFSTFSSHNSYSHNIVRDTMLVIGGHIVWTVVTTVMVSAIMGMSQVNVVTNSTGVVDCLVKSSAAMSSISQGQTRSRDFSEYVFLNETFDGKPS